ncbi:MAG: DHH family phosphoesterase [Lachnospiraceae bacterium]|nr:DHH family phosphoesterase [Lachnospiraceae bacterium]
MSDAVWTVCNIKGDFDAISEKHQITRRLARIMVNRGITSEADICAYLYGNISDTHDPHGLKNIEKAADIISDAVKGGRKLFIIGDYDIDGVCASYILKKGISLCYAKKAFSETGGSAFNGVSVGGLHNFHELLDNNTVFDHFSGNIRVRLPDRQKDGYGMNRAMVDEALKFGASVIVTCDNGIAAFDEVRYAKEKGLKVVVTDHHEVPYDEGEVSDAGTDAGQRDFSKPARAGELNASEKKYIIPPADAVVDPKQADCGYPFEGICGGVVAYKLVSVLFERFGIGEEFLSELLIFAAVSTVGDIMELTDENRLFVKFGIKEMEKKHNIGFDALVNACGISKGDITPYHIGYVLGPCINATGRLDLADRALRLFESDNDVKASMIAAELKELNDSRKEIQTLFTEKAFSMIDEDPSYEKDKVLVIFLPDCHESLAGLIAGKLREKYYKPVFVLTRGEEAVKGSGRSVEAYNMYEEMSRVKDLFIKFGGHKMAAGLSIKEENVGILRKRLNENTTLTDGDLIRKLKADMQLKLSGADLDFAKELEKLEPYGTGNPRPLFVERDIVIYRKQVLGKNRNVLRLSVAPASAFDHGKLTDWASLREAVIYGDACEISQELEGKDTIMLMYELSVNRYMGNESVQLVVRDYKY